MVKTKNLTPHILDLEKDFLGPHRSRDVDLTEKDKINLVGKIGYDCQEKEVANVEDIKEEKPAEKKEEKPGILNESVIDNYLDKNRRVILNDLDEDKEKLSEKDLNLIIEYESEHKKRQKVIGKAEEMLEELKQKNKEVSG